MRGNFLLAPECVTKVKAFSHLLQAGGGQASEAAEALQQAVAAELPSDEADFEDERESPQEPTASTAAESSSSSPVAPSIPGNPADDAAASSSSGACLPRPEDSHIESEGPSFSAPASSQSDAELQKERAIAAALPPDDDDEDEDDDEDSIEAAADAQRDQAAATALPAHNEARADEQSGGDIAAAQIGRDSEELRRDQAAAAPLPSDDDDDADDDDERGADGHVHTAPMQSIRWPMYTQSAHAAAEQITKGEETGLSCPQQTGEDLEEESAGSTSAPVLEPPGFGSVASQVDEGSEESTSASAMTPTSHAQDDNHAGDSVTSTTGPDAAAAAEPDAVVEAGSGEQQPKADGPHGGSDAAGTVASPSSPPKQGRAPSGQSLQPFGQAASGPTSAPLFTSSAQSRPAPLFDLSSVPSGSKFTTPAATSSNGSKAPPGSFSMPAFGQSAPGPAFGRPSTGSVLASGSAASLPQQNPSSAASGEATRMPASGQSTSAFGLTGQMPVSTQSAAASASMLPFGRILPTQAPGHLNATAEPAKATASSLQSKSALSSDDTKAHQFTPKQALRQGMGRSPPVNQQFLDQDSTAAMPSTSFGQMRPSAMPENDPSAAQFSDLQTPALSTAAPSAGPQPLSAGFQARQLVSQPSPLKASAASQALQQKGRDLVHGERPAGPGPMAGAGSGANQSPAANMQGPGLERAPIPKVPAPVPQLAGQLSQSIRSINMCLQLNSLSGAAQQRAMKSR